MNDLRSSAAQMNRPHAVRMNWGAGLIAGAIVLWLFTLICGYIALMHFIDGVSVLDSREKLQKFMAKTYQDGRLMYDGAQDLGGTLTVNGSEGKTEYAVWRLSGDGYAVLYCTDVPFDGQREVHVQSILRNLAPQVIEDFAPGEDVFVLYDAGSPAPFLIMMGAFAALGLVMFVVAKKRF